ncbi:aspartic proteinase 36-like [Impatiens glandulifera]|uniref:aspartic proteinase 36-like n=1 Tax=Impatiens glandulifera TaxID=253017 RepID=UPI001FB0B88F|nr:aspartic proteinase 36-like [Impatiens glandulifera]
MPANIRPLFKILAFLAAVFPPANAAGITGTILTLERAFPANHNVGLEKLIARDQARHARILQGVSGGIVDFSVTGNSDPNLAGLYLTKVKLGSPPREFNVQIDTGSDVLWVNCNSCSDCPSSTQLGIELNLFNPANSYTSSLISCSDTLCSSMVHTTAAQCFTESNQCGYSFRYGDGSGTSGFYLQDLLYFDTIMGTSLMENSSAPIIFGCSTSVSGDLTKEDRAIDGIFGFGQQDLSVMTQLSSRGITPRIFSHCLRGEGDGGGILVLGEILDSRIVYTPLVPSQPHYNLYLESISINGQPLPIDQAVFETSYDRGTIVDSGTTLSYLVAEAYDLFISAVNDVISQYATLVISKGNQCYKLSDSGIDMFPRVAFNFAGGVSMVLTPKDYLLNYGPIDGVPSMCIGFQKAQGQDITILGDLVLKDKIIVYDLARQQLGWADYDCSMSVNVSITSGKDEFVSAGELTVNASSPGKIKTWIISFIMQAILIFASTVK